MGLHPLRSSLLSPSSSPLRTSNLPTRLFIRASSLIKYATRIASSYCNSVGQRTFLSALRMPEITTASAASPKSVLLYFCVCPLYIPPKA